MRHVRRVDGHECIALTGHDLDLVMINRRGFDELPRFQINIAGDFAALFHRSLDVFRYSHLSGLPDHRCGHCNRRWSGSHRRSRDRRGGVGHGDCPLNPGRRGRRDGNERCCGGGFGSDCQRCLGRSALHHRSWCRLRSGLHGHTFFNRNWRRLGAFEKSACNKSNDHRQRIKNHCWSLQRSLFLRFAAYPLKHRVFHLYVSGGI